ncbi:MAG: Chaperone protein DnaK, partial [Verrucomicrobiota bacterium]
MDPIVGIDLGTTNSLVGCMEAGFAVLIADAQGERLTPSVVHFSAGEGVLVGREAERKRAVDPESTVCSVKRFMGRRVGEESVETPYPVVGGMGDWARVEAGGRRWL